MRVNVQLIKQVTIPSLGYLRQKTDRRSRVVAKAIADQLRANSPVKKSKSSPLNRRTIQRPTMLLTWAGLYTETGGSPVDILWQGISEKGALGPKFALAWAPCQMLIPTVTSQRIFSRQSPSVKRHGGQPRPLLFSLISVRQYGPGLLSLRLPKRLRHRGALLEQARPLCRIAARFPNR